MPNLYDRDHVLAILREMTHTEPLLRHAYAVEAAMRAAAVRCGEDVALWGAAGLLHDLDYERFPTVEDHPYRGAELLRERGYPESFVRVLLSHAPYTGVPRENACARWLFAVDELCGFCMACAMVQPDRRVASVKVKSVKKKLKQKSFAAKVNRDEIHEGAEDLGLPLEEVIDHVLTALRGAADDLGL